MKILVSNDDGFHAVGIQTLAKTLRQAGHKVVVVAPDSNRSAASSCLTLVDPLRVHQFDAENYAVIAGTPADCVHLALNGLFDEQLNEKDEMQYHSLFKRVSGLEVTIENTETGETTEYYFSSLYSKEAVMDCDIMIAEMLKEFNK